MMNKIITDEGKTELLRLGFANTNSNAGFQFLALGKEGSEGASNGTFSEVTDANYHRVETTIEEDIIGDEKTISISGIFDEANYSPSEGGLIKEIGLVNSESSRNDEIFFMYSEVPEIYKTDSISLKYTIVISIS